jgi:hypothetical protein
VKVLINSNCVQLGCISCSVAKGLSKLPVFLTSLDEPEILKAEFDNLVAAAFAVSTENREKEENSILN